MGSRPVLVSDAAPASQAAGPACLSGSVSRGVDWAGLWPRRRRPCWPSCALRSPGLAAAHPRPRVSVPGLLGSAGDAVAVHGAAAPPRQPFSPCKADSVGANGHVLSCESGVWGVSVRCRMVPVIERVFWVLTVVRTHSNEGKRDGFSGWGCAAEKGGQQTEKPAGFTPPRPPTRAALSPVHRAPGSCFHGSLIFRRDGSSRCRVALPSYFCVAFRRLDL